MGGIQRWSGPDLGNSLISLASSQGRRKHTMDRRPVSSFRSDSPSLEVAFKIAAVFELPLESVFGYSWAWKQGWVGWVRQLDLIAA
jgi:hypothetical protein